MTDQLASSLMRLQSEHMERVIRLQERMDRSSEPLTYNNIAVLDKELQCIKGIWKELDNLLNRNDSTMTTEGLENVVFWEAFQSLEQAKTMEDVRTIVRAAMKEARSINTKMVAIPCEHPNIKDAPIHKGNCACSCRDYRFCPDCEKIEEIDIEEAR